MNKHDKNNFKQSDNIDYFWNLGESSLYMSFRQKGQSM